jgi:hypothetical protein
MLIERTADHCTGIWSPLLHLHLRKARSPMWQAHRSPKVSPPSSAKLEPALEASERPTHFRRIMLDCPARCC